MRSFAQVVDELTSLASKAALVPPGPSRSGETHEEEAASGGALPAARRLPRAIKKASLLSACLGRRDSASAPAGEAQLPSCPFMRGAVSGRGSSASATAEESSREGSGGFARGRDGRQPALHGWHDDGAEPSVDRPGRAHERSSAIAAHEQLRRDKSCGGGELQDDDQRGGALRSEDAAAIARH